MQKVSSQIARMWQIRRVIKKYGLVSLLDELNLSKSARLAARTMLASGSTLTERRGVRIRQALEELGPVFVKLGQTLSTRPDLLHAAGIETAKTLVVALDDKNAAIQLVKYARSIRPDLHIVARAHDRVHVYELFQAGANDIVREMFDSSLRAGRYVLEGIGLTDYDAAEFEHEFFKQDRHALRELATLWDPNVALKDNPEYVKRAKELNKEQETKLLERLQDTPAPTADKG